jgi:hypothetical protein
MEILNNYTVEIISRKSKRQSWHFWTVKMMMLRLMAFAEQTVFFVILAIREKFLSKLFCMSQEDNEKLCGLNVDYYLIGEEKYTTETPHQGKNRIQIYLCKDVLLI